MDLILLYHRENGRMPTDKQYVRWLEMKLLKFEKELKVSEQIANMTNVDLAKTSQSSQKSKNDLSPYVSNSVCYNGGFEKATRWHDCANEDCKTCECNQQTDC